MTTKPSDEMIKQIEDEADDFFNNNCDVHKDDADLAFNNYLAGRLKSLEQLAAKDAMLRECLNTFEGLKNLVNNDYMISKTEDGEKEYWVNNQDLQHACDEIIEKLDAMEGGNGTT